MEEEDINHALLYCFRLKDVLLSQLNFLQENVTQMDFIHVVNQVLQRNKAGELEKLFLCAWRIWYSINQFIYENKRIAPKQAIDHALLVANEYKSVAKEQKKGVQSNGG